MDSFSKPVVDKRLELYLVVVQSGIADSGICVYSYRSIGVFG
jgi:hypothetical protein